MRLVSEPEKMISRGLVVLSIVSTCVLSLPVTPSQLENEDVKVKKCIVEVLADVLSKPRPIPVSQDCLVTLKTDDRLISILRHQNFLKELQEIAVLGGLERAQLQRDASTPDPTTPTPQTGGDIADRSMLEALGGPGERSILAQKSRTGHGDREGEKDESMGDEESQEDNNSTEVKRENDEKPGSHSSESVEEWSEDKAEKRKEEEEEYEEKKANSEENMEKNMTKDKKGAVSGQKGGGTRNKSKVKKFGEEDEEETDKRSALLSHKHEEKPEEEEDEGETKRGSRESLKRWTKRGKALPLKRKALGKEAQQLGSQQEVPHHSKEVSDEGEEKEKRDMQRSPEEKELQMIARRGPEERRGLEEEGSASRKSEEPEIESLAAIESELENVAQKLHELRRG